MYRIITYRFIPYILSGLLYVALHLLVFSNFMPGQLFALFVDALLYAVLLAASGFALRSLLHYGRLESLPLVQRVGNLFLLGLLLLGLVSLISYSLESLWFEAEVSRSLSLLLPVKALLVFLLYIILLQYYILRYKPESEETEIPEEESAVVLPESLQEELTVKEVLERITVKNGTKIDVLLVDDLVYVESYGDYVYLYTGTGRYIKEQTMKYFEDSLPAGKFVRIHRSYIVNVEDISRIELYEKQSRQVILKNGNTLKVSPSGYRLLKEVLGI